MPQRSMDSALSASDLWNALALAGLRPDFAVHTHTASQRTGTATAACPTADGGAGIEGWQFALEPLPVDAAALPRLRLRARCTGASPATLVGLQWRFTTWSRDNYVLVPGAVYDGNRQPAVPDRYPPMPAPAPPAGPTSASPPPDLGAALQYSSVPGLNPGAGPSRLEQLANDGARPAIGVWLRDAGLGFWLLTAPELASNRDLLRRHPGFDLEERGDEAVLRLDLPGLRHEFAYEACRADAPSAERAPDFTAGDELSLEFCLDLFPCERPQDLFDRLLAHRRAALPAPRRREDLPFSAALTLLTEKFNRDNWVEPAGYYSVGVEPMRSRHISQDWQIGWVGGMISTHALLLAGDPVSCAHVRANLDFVFREGQARSGFFLGMGGGGQWAGDHFRAPEAPWHLVRKSADGLFYMLASLEVMEARGETLQPAWLTGLQRCADAFVRLWDEAGEFGQFVDHDTGKLIVAGSTSGAIAPAALLQAARRFPARTADYRRVALAAATRYAQLDLARGLTTGGPGDAAQVPDSESAAGLVESFVTAFEHTGDRTWLDAAEAAAAQLASWVVPYDFAFPPDSTFGQLNLPTTGTVMANAQNKHSAPGLCTHSGGSLLRLFRHTGRRVWLELLADIAHALPHFLSRADRPIRFTMPYNAPTDPAETTLRPGWMCERVNLTQWGPHEGIGEVFYYSCWSEVSLLLSTTELPGVYAQPDTGLCVALDHVQASWRDAPGGRRLWLRNPTRFPATVTVCLETAAAAASQPWSPLRPSTWQRLTLPPGAEAAV